MRYWPLLLIFLIGCAPNYQHLRDDSDTANPLPCGTIDSKGNPTASCSSFGTQLGTFLSSEDADRSAEYGFGNFVSVLAQANSCLGAPVASLTMTPTSCTAYNAGFRSIETGAITFPDASTCWVAMDENTTGNNAGLPNFGRVAGTHYLTDCIDVGAPAMAADSQLLMKVVTAGGAVTAVTDERTTAPIVTAGTGTVTSGTGPAIAQYPSGTHTTVSPVTVSGDATIAQGGALTVTKTNGVAFATSATTDTTNATNITSGTLPNAQLPSTITVAHVVGSTDITDTGLTPSRCVQTGAGGILVSSAGNCATTAGIAQGGPLTQNLSAGTFQITNLPAVTAANQALSEGHPIGAVATAAGTFASINNLGIYEQGEFGTAEAGGGTITPDCSQGGIAIIIGDNSAWTLGNPTNCTPSGGLFHWYIRIANTSGGAGGTITLGAQYRTDSSWSTTGPANGKLRVCPVSTNTTPVHYIGPCTGDETI